MNNRKSIQIWMARSRLLSRIWVCSHCGAKIYCGRLTAKPVYRCLCGKACWQQVDNQSPFLGRYK